MTIQTRPEIEQLEERTLAPFAVRAADSRGRDVPEPPDPHRTEFQRDRDRILHCAAFRKLEYKTQVYVTHEGDNFRTRLTHTLEVAQIARTLAQCLRLNSALTEAIALAHDLGHTPFGHMGEQVLAELLTDQGGFEHNAQSLRLVEVLEERYHDRPGLNLTWEVREGLAYHSSAVELPSIRKFLEGGAPSLEGQLVDVADGVAYNHHDLDDALGMGLLTVEELRDLPWIGELWQAEAARLPEGVGNRIRRYRFLGALMDLMVNDVLSATLGRIKAEGIDSPRAAREFGAALVCFSPEMAERQQTLRAFLMERVYRHPVTLRMQSKAGGFFRKLFELFRDNPELLPREVQGRLEAWGLERVLVDHLSGMTDRQCLEAYIEHFEPTLRHQPM